MKKLAVFACVAVFTMAVMVMPAMAGGLPAKHGVDGKTFGGLVSNLAKSDPSALVMHITGR